MSKTFKEIGRLQLSCEQQRLLSEIERQEYYVSRLPNDFRFAFSCGGRPGVLSQRRNGYRTTGKAASEIVDNALEAGARNIWLVFDRPNEGEPLGHRSRDRVRAIAFIDDGPGMTRKMARYALTWGGGTHFEDPHNIGKFGFGLGRYFTYYNEERLHQSLAGRLTVLESQLGVAA